MNNFGVDMPPATDPGAGNRTASSVRKVWLSLLLLLVLLAGAMLYSRPMAIYESAVRLKLLLTGVQSKFVTLDGHRIHYWVGGKGTPLLLVHGLASRGSDWSALIPQFIHAGFRVYAIDLLGYGDSDRPADSSFSIPVQAAVVEAFLESQQLNHVDLAGASMGGWVAMRAAADQPQRIDRLILYDAAGFYFVPKFNLSMFMPHTPDELNAFYAELTPHPPRVPDFIARDILRQMLARRWVVNRSLASMATGADVMDGKVANLRMPVLIVFGSDDRVIPPSVGRALHAEIPQSVLELFAGCGHVAPNLCASRIGPRSIEFLKAQPPLSAAVYEIPQ